MIDTHWSRLWLAAGLTFAVAAQQPTDLADPVKLEADRKVIDTIADIGHAGPLLQDHDGDGKLDLLVSSFRGSIRCFHNTGDATSPKWTEKEPLQAGGKPIRIHNW